MQPGAGKVALLSAKKYAPSVVPIMLYPGNYNAYMKWFEQEGGLAFHHRTSLLPRWQVRWTHEPTGWPGP